MGFFARTFLGTLIVWALILVAAGIVAFATIAPGWLAATVITLIIGAVIGEMFWG